MIEIPLSKQGKHKGKYVAIVDNIDADLAEVRWAIEKALYTSYSCRKNSKGGSNIKMHRVVMERVLGRVMQKGEVVDHINGNGLDNRRQNLRLATNAQNLMNRKANSNNTSGYKGVTLVKGRKKWVAKIKRNYKLYNLGYFNTPEEAHEAYCKAADELHKDFANYGLYELK